MKFFYAAISLLFIQLNFSQVGIGTTSPNGLLDITVVNPSAPSTTDGLLIPRVLAFPSPVGAAQNGMLVFLTTPITTYKVGLYYYDFPSTTWKWMSTGNNGDIWAYNNANSRIELPFQSNGTTARPLGNEVVILDNGNAGFGLNIPTYKLHVRGDIASDDGIYSRSLFNVGTSAATIYSDNIEPWTDNGVRLYDGNSLSHLHLESRGYGFLQSYGTSGAVKNVLENSNTSDLILQPSGSKVGIGSNLSPAAILDVTGDITASTGYYYNGKSSPANIELTRSLPTTVNNTIDIGNFSIVNGTHSFRLSVTANIPNFSVSKSYVISCKYNQTANVWQILQPIANTGSFAATDDFEVDINVNNAITSLRLRKTLGAIGGNIQIRLESTGAITDVFSSTAVIATVAAPTVIFQTNAFSNSWTTTGNSGTVDGSNFIGTTDNIPFNIKVNNQKSGRISSTGETFFGFEAGKNNANTGTTSNTAFGYKALTSNTTTGRENTAIGQTALTTNNGGDYNTALGSAALNSNIIGNNNTALGKSALSSNTGNDNTAVGWEALITNTSGSNNIAIGRRALRYYLTNSNNIAIGYEALAGGTVAASVTAAAINNVAIGNNALNGNLSGAENSAFGNDALKFNTSGSQNSAFGYQALLASTTGVENTAVGRKAMQVNTTGKQNTALGFNALFSNNSDNNTGVGRQALYTNSSGNNNTAVGFNSLFNNLSGNNNTALGNLAGQNIISGSNNIIIGANTNIQTATVSDQMNVGNAIYGTTMTSTSAAKIGIGVTNPGTRFQVGLDHTLPNVGGMVQVNLNDADSQLQGLKVSVKKTTGINYAVNGTAFGTGATENIGLYGYALNATGKNWGLYIEEGDAYVKGVVAVGTLLPNASALLDLTSTNKGLLLPRMTKAERNTITKVAGLMIYQTDNTPGLRVCDGVNWVRYTETNDN